MTILKYLGLRTGRAADAEASTLSRAASSDADSIRRISKALDRLEPARARQIASLAFVLSRVAGADLEISQDEIREMERIVMEVAGLPEEQAVLVVEIARRQNIMFGGTDNFLVTRALKESLSREEKEQLLHCLFAVSAADEAISSAEEATVAQIASELGVDHREMLQIRAAYRDKRSVMKDLPR